MKYFQIGIVGVAVLLIPLTSNQHDTSRDWRSLRATMIATICDLLTEMMCWIVDGQTYPGAMAINTFFAYWTIVFQSLVAVLWFSYVLQLLDWEVPHKYRRLIYLPFIYNMVDLALNPFTNARFIITAANRYTLGLLAPLDIAVTSIYVLSATFMAFIKLKHAVNAYEKHSCYVIIASIILPIIGMTLQWVFDGSYLLLIFFAIGLLCIFINIQNNHITMDNLTGIYNRAYLLVQYDRLIKRVRPGSAMFMLVIDVNEFKKVNDTLGHLAGDHALMEIAGVLRETCVDGNGLPARIGGDENSASSMRTSTRGSLTPTSTKSTKAWPRTTKAEPSPFPCRSASATRNAGAATPPSIRICGRPTG